MTSPFDENNDTRRRGMIARLRTNFLAGLVVVLPIGLTLWLIWSVVGWIDGVVLPFLPDAIEPANLINQYVGEDSRIRQWLGQDTRINVRGIGVIIFFLFTMLVGWMAKGVIGRSFLRWGEGVVSRMPVVRSIYNGVKQLAETVFAQTEASFEKACLIEYPRKGIWAIAFISTHTKGEVLTKANTGPMTSVFVPTTPNPTSGFLLFFPTKDIIKLDMSVEDAAKLVISAGLVYPNGEGGVTDDAPE